MGLRRLGLALALGLLGLQSQAAWAQATPPGAAFADGCSGCHGQGGRSRGSIPSLVGWQAAPLAAAMRAYRDGQRPGTVMGRIAKGFTDAEIDGMAAAIAAGPRKPRR